MITFKLRLLFMLVCYLMRKKNYSNKMIKC